MRNLTNALWSVLLPYNEFMCHLLECQRYMSNAYDSNSFS